MEFVESVDINKAYRMINHGPTVLISSHHEGVDNVMAAAWSDTRVFKNGRWNFETSDPQLKSIHHVAGGQYYTIGEPVHSRKK